MIKLDSRNYHFGRFDWMTTHDYLDEKGLPKIGMWEENGEVVAAATYDCVLGRAYPIILKDYGYLANGIFLYA